MTLVKAEGFPHLGLLDSKLIEHCNGFVDLGIECIRRVEQMEELRVVHLEEHAGDLSSQIRLSSRFK